MKNNTILKESDIINYIHDLIGEMLDDDFQRVKMFGEFLDKAEPVRDDYLLSRAYELTNKLKKQYNN